MLNPGFSEEAEQRYGSTYVVPRELSASLVGANSEFATGRELRTQAVYGDELWSRLEALGVAELPWTELALLDACCGSGFLSYHLAQRVRPRRLTLLDVSSQEITEAGRLIGTLQDGAGVVSTICGDLSEVTLASQAFDVVVGNSFLHHFPDVPDVLSTIFRLVRPGGWFIGLHEPTPVALPLESGDPRQLLAYLLSRRRYLGGSRYRGEGMMSPGTTDVWIFEINDVRRLLTTAGFTEITIVPRYLVRPFTVAAMKLHLSKKKPRLSRFEAFVLSRCVSLDGLLRRVLPSSAFGGLSFAARRPN